MITALLLAAGSARRFGSQKLLARLPDGRRVVEASATHLLVGAGRVIAVARRDDALIRVLDDCGCQVVINDNADDGMGGSIAAGIDASGEASGWLIALGDMPFIRPQTIAAIVDSLKVYGGIVVPVYRGERGHPVAFSAEYGPALKELSGDAGARQIVNARPDAITLLPVDDPGILADIDTPEDLAARHGA